MWKIFEKKSYFDSDFFFNFQRVTIIYLLVLCKPNIGVPIFLPFYVYQTRAPALLPKTIMPYVIPLYSPSPPLLSILFLVFKTCRGKKVRQY